MYSGMISKTSYLSDDILQVRAEEQCQVLHYFLHCCDDTQEKQFIPVGNIMITFSNSHCGILVKEKSLSKTL